MGSLKALLSIRSSTLWLSSELTKPQFSAGAIQEQESWNGSPIPRKGNIRDSHSDVEPATLYVLSAEKTT
jgi:hypothetical protein